MNTEHVEAVEVRHDGGHYVWATVTWTGTNRKVTQAEMVNSHHKPNIPVDDQMSESIQKAIKAARRRCAVAWKAIEKAEA